METSDDRIEHICQYCDSPFTTRRGVVITECNCENYEPGDLYD